MAGPRAEPSFAELAGSRQARLAALALVGALVYSYGDVLRTLQWQWFTNDAYSYGYLIPFISGWLVWRRRDWLGATRLAPTFLPGLLCLAMGAAGLVIGRKTGVTGVEELSLLSTVAGLVLLFLGWKIFRVLALPFAYLFFMIPIWDVVTDRLHFPFQMLSAALSTELLRLWHVPVLRDGIYLQLPVMTLEVARACSGVNYLIAVLAISVPTSYLFLPDRTRRLLLIGFAMTVAILTNSARVALIGLLAYHGLSSELHGPGHVLQGVLVAMVGYVAIFVGTVVLARTVKRPPVPAPAVTPPVVTSPDVRGGWESWRIAVAVGLLVLVANLGTNAHASTESADPYPALLPNAIGEWRSQPVVESWNLDLPEMPSDQAWRTFEGASGQRVQLYVGRYAGTVTPSGPGGYWTDSLESLTKRATIETASGDRFQANYALVGQRGTRVHFLYWYSIGGRMTADRFVAKLNAILHQVINVAPAPMVVVVAASRGAGEQATVDEMTSFAGAMWPLLKARLSGDRAASPTKETTRGNARSGVANGPF